MKKLFILVLSLFLLSSFYVSAIQNLNFSQESKESSEFSAGYIPVFRVKDIRQDPSPANPGEYLDLYFRIDNFGGAITNPRFELKLPQWLIIDPSTLNDNFPSLGAGEKVTLHYKIRVDKNALPGDYEGSFKAFAAPETFYPYFFNIRVNDVTSTFDVALQDVSKDGVALVISNTGKNTANSITVNIPEQDNFDLLGPSSFIIGNLNAGDYTVISSFIAPKDDVSSDNLNLNFSVEYTDSVGTRRDVDKSIRIIMTNKVRNGFNDLKDSLVYGIEKTNGTSGSSFYKYAAIILVIVLIAVVTYFRRKLANHSNEEE